jgi:carnosine N-methyltransferase
VNIGPLLWHYSDLPNEVQVELSLEEVMDLLPKFGFKLRKQEFKRCSYTARPNCMLTMEYESIFFSAVKAEDYN